MRELIDLLDKRAADANFISPEGGSLILNDNSNWPDGNLKNQERYWSTKFAAVLLVRIDGVTAKDAWKETIQAQSFLDAALLPLEKNGAVVDGYLVLAINEINDGLKQFINEVERDTRFVRKHVIYKKEGAWMRCQRITPLGIVRPAKQAQHHSFVADDVHMKSLLNSLSATRGKDLAHQHGKEWDLNE